MSQLGTATVAAHMLCASGFVDDFIYVLDNDVSSGW